MNDLTAAPPRTLRSGIIGGGFMGDAHAQAARSARGLPVAIASSSLASAEHAARRIGIARAHSSALDLIRDPDVDVVHICTPNSTHASLALAAIEAGKHVVCEKPLATDVRDARSIVAAADAAGVVAAVPFVYRYHPLVREARARVARGEVGRVTTMQGHYLQDWLLSSDDENWRTETGPGGPSRAFADIGSHLADMLEFVSADRLSRIQARTSTVFDRRGDRAVETEDIAAVLFETVGGALGTMMVSQVSPGRKNALTIEIGGTMESLRFEQERPERLWVGRRNESAMLVRDPDFGDPSAGRLSGLPAGHPMGYRDAFTGFIADVYTAIGGEEPDGLPRFADGLRAVELTEGVLRSASLDDWVDV